MYNYVITNKSKKKQGLALLVVLQISVTLKTGTGQTPNLEGPWFPPLQKAQGWGTRLLAPVGPRRWKGELPSLEDPLPPQHSEADTPSRQGAEESRSQI